MSERKGFISRMSTFFGRKEGQTTKDFGDELKQLTANDRADFVRWFNEAGMPTDDAVPSK